MGTPLPWDPADTPDPRFPRTERAFNAGQDWAGIWAAEQITSQIVALSPESRQLLKPAIRRLQDAVERLCPVTLQATSHGLAVGYGPTQVGRDTLVLAASPRHYAGFHLQAWPEPDDIAVQVAAKRPVFWTVLADCIKTGDIDGILRLLVARYTAQELSTLDQRASICRQLGHTPTVVVIVGHKKQANGMIAAAGVFGVISLPPGTEVQIAESEGTA